MDSANRNLPTIRRIEPGRELNTSGRFETQSPLQADDREVGTSSMNSRRGRGQGQSQSSNSSVPDYQSRQRNLPYARRQNIYVPQIDPKLPAPLRALFLPLKCELCSVNLQLSTLTAKAHYEGKKHLANVRQWLTDRPQYKDILPEANQKSEMDKDRLYCKYCDLTMTSESQAQSHYVGQKHQSVMNKKIMKNAFLNQATGQWERVETAKEDKTGRFGIGLGFVSGGNAGPGPSTASSSGHRFFCDLCEVACPSQVSLNNHFSGSKHLRKVGQNSNPFPEEYRLYDKCGVSHRLNSVRLVDLSIGHGVQPNFLQHIKSEAVDKRTECRTCHLRIFDIHPLFQTLRQDRQHLIKHCMETPTMKCDICQFHGKGTKAMVDHQRRRSHEVILAQNMLNVRGVKGSLVEQGCQLCQFTAKDDTHLMFHLISDEHEAKVREQDSSAVDGTEAIEEKQEACDIDFHETANGLLERNGDYYVCKICKCKLPMDKMDLLMHLKSLVHIVNIYKHPDFCGSTEQVDAALTSA